MVAISGKKAQAFRQLGFWERNRTRIDAERDKGLTGSYLRARRNTGRPFRPWNLRHLVDHEFHARKAYEMAGHVALCLVLDEGFPCLVLTYADWAELLGCCERTAGSTARELAAGQWIEIRWHFVPYTGAHGRRCHAQMLCSFAPGPLMRIAYAIHQAQRAGDENLTGRAYREVLHSDGKKKLPAKGERSFHGSASILTSSYGSPGYPQAHRRRSEHQFNSKHSPRLLETGRRGQEDRGACGAPEAVRERPLTRDELLDALQASQAALSQAFGLVASLAPKPQPGLPRRELLAFTRFIHARLRREAAANAARATAQQEIRLLHFRAKVPARPLAEWNPAELREVLECKPHCTCALCWAQNVPPLVE